MPAEVTAAEVLARSLRNEGVRFVFGLPCPEIDALLAQLEPNGMRFFPIRHEAAAVHMAQGLYKSTGQFAVVLGNPGPGSANLLPGLITAMHEGVPVLAITSQHHLRMVYPATPATFQGQDQLELFRPAVKWGAPIFMAERVPEVVRAAARHAWAGRPGPVQIEIPASVLGAKVTAQAAALWPADAGRGYAPEASGALLDRAAQMLAEAKRPAIFAGCGVDRGDANDELLQLIELLRCPVMTSMAGRSVVPRDHPRLLSGLGPGSDEVRREADVVLVAGSRLGNLDLPFDKYWGARGAQRLIQIDVEPRHLGVTRPVALGIVSELRPALAGLRVRLSGRQMHGYDAEGFARVIAAERAAEEQQRATFAAYAGPGMHPAQVIQRVGEFFGRDAIYTVDGGNTSLWAHFALPGTRPRSYHGILEFGMLGTGIPGAIGSKLGAPEREVVCVTGDGAAGFHFMELQCAAREEVEVTVVVMAEGAWTMEEINERIFYGRTFGTDQGPVRWDRVAEGLGCHGESVMTLNELAPALERAREAKGRPRVISVHTSRDANLALPGDRLLRMLEVYQGPDPLGG